MIGEPATIRFIQVAMTSTEATSAPALKNIFDASRIRHIARETSAVYPAFKSKRFIELSLNGLEERSVMQRLRHLAQVLHETLPDEYPKALTILHELAPRLNHSFVSMVLPEYVALYGAEYFDQSMEALKVFTTFGSSEFAIRHFLRSDLKRTLKVMQRWSEDEDEHVRRLSSEGSRPRLPWSFKLDAMIAKPELTLPILRNLRSDDSLYVRKSVANHLNDISKDNTNWLLDHIETWKSDDRHTVWIARQALRSLIKKGDKRALTIIGAGATPEVVVKKMKVDPKVLQLGGSITLSFDIQSISVKPQHLVIDYAVHYVKKSGGSSPKVFKLKTLALAPGAKATVSRMQSIRDFSTRVHYAGKHEVIVFINGEQFAKSFFELRISPGDYP